MIYMNDPLDVDDGSTVMDYMKLVRTYGELEV